MTVTITYQSVISGRYYFIDCESETEADDLVQSLAESALATEITVTR